MSLAGNEQKTLFPVSFLASSVMFYPLIMSQLPHSSLQTPVIPVNEALWTSRFTIAVYKSKRIKETRTHTHTHSKLSFVTSNGSSLLWQTSAFLRLRISKSGRRPAEAEPHLPAQERGVVPSRCELLWAGNLWSHMAGKQRDRMF